MKTKLQVLDLTKNFRIIKIEERLENNQINKNKIKSEVKMIGGGGQGGGRGGGRQGMAIMKDRSKHCII